MSQMPEMSAPGRPEQGPDQGWQQQPIQPGWVVEAEPAIVLDAEGGQLPTEFDHLFRGSTPDSRRSIDQPSPPIGAAQPSAYFNAQAEAQPQPGYPQQGGGYPQQGGGYDQAPEQHPEQYQQAYGYQDGYQNQYAQSQQYQQAAPYGAPNGYGDGQWGGEPPRPSKRPALLIGGAVAAVAVIGVAVMLSGGGGTAKPRATATHSASAAASTSPQQEAAAVFQIIDRSGQLRSDANGAVVEVSACRDLSAAQSLLQSTAQKRQSQADEVAKLDVAKIPEGAALVQALQQAWTASAQADTAYAGIAADLASGCKPAQVKKDPNYQVADDAGRSATNAKDQAAQLWNNNAVSLGQQPIAAGRLYGVKRLTRR